MTTEKEDTEFLENIRRLASSGILVIAEGKKDRAALNAFGITNIRLLSRKAIYEICEEIVDSGEKRAAILTDLDTEGRKLYSRLNSELSEKGIVIDNTMREFLFRETKVRQIEGITSYFSSCLPESRT
jgi:5S rRNA maturation endonuclease (ribonuclease M5)